RIDSAGNIYLAGHTLSDDFFDGDRTPNLSGFDMTIDDEFEDIFLIKFNEDLSDVLYGTFWGGTGSEFMDWKTMRAADDGMVYMAGVVFDNGPLTANAYDSTPPGADRDGFVVKIDTTTSGSGSLEY